MTEPVVPRALLVVAENGVGLRRFLELLLGLGIAGILVWVELQRQLAVGLLDLIKRGAALDAETS